MAGLAPDSESIGEGLFCFLLSWKSDPVNSAQAEPPPCRPKTPRCCSRGRRLFLVNPSICPRQTALCQLGLVSSQLFRDVQVTLFHQLCLHRASPWSQGWCPSIGFWTGALGPWWSLLSPRTAHNDSPHPPGRGWFGVGIDHGKLSQLPRIVL